MMAVILYQSETLWISQDWTRQLTDTKDIEKPNNTGSGYIKDITEISIEEFTNIIEKIADVRAENGAEQQRVNQSMRLQQNNLVNLEAALGIMDTMLPWSPPVWPVLCDCASECGDGKRHPSMTSVALTLLQ